MCTWVQILAPPLTCSVGLCKFHMLSVPLTHKTVVKVKLAKTHKILEIVSGIKHGLIVCYCYLLCVLFYCSVLKCWCLALIFSNTCCPWWFHLPLQTIYMLIIPTSWPLSSHLSFTSMYPVTCSTYLLFMLCTYIHCIQSWVDCILFPSCFSFCVPYHRKWKYQLCTSQLDIRNKASTSPLLFSSFHFQSIAKCCLSNLLITLKATCFLHLHCCWHKVLSSFTCKTVQPPLPAYICFPWLPPTHSLLSGKALLPVFMPPTVGSTKAQVLVLPSRPCWPSASSQAAHILRPSHCNFSSIITSWVLSSF